MANPKPSHKFPKGHKGKPKGALNKTTTEARELFLNILAGQVPHIEESFAELKAKNRQAYLDTLAKFFPYFLPKKVDVTTNDESITGQSFTIAGKTINF